MFMKHQKEKFIVLTSTFSYTKQRSVSHRNLASYNRETVANNPRAL